MRHGIALLTMALMAGCGGQGGSSGTGGGASQPAASASPAGAPAAAPGQEAAATRGGGLTAGDSGPCAYVTEAEASEIMGHAMKKGEANSPQECLMVSASGDTTKSVSFQVMPGTQMYDASAKGLPAVEGVGEKAAAMGGGNVIIAVANGRTFMGGVYDGQNLAAGKERSIALARKAVARM
jgi:hypothetical protein